MILKAKHHFLLDPFFRYYVIRKMHRNFQEVNIVADITDKGLPLLMICNHVSWWDGIWALHVNQTLFKRKYYYMMLEEQLRKNWFLNYAGGYSIPDKIKGIAESLNYTNNLLENNKNLVLLFPQGEIESMHRQNFHFKRGIERILKNLKNEIQVVFLVNLIDYHSNVKPTAYSYVGSYDGKYETNGIQEAYNHYYVRCLSAQIKIKS